MSCHFSAKVRKKSILFDPGQNSCALIGGQRGGKLKKGKIRKDLNQSLADFYSVRDEDTNSNMVLCVINVPPIDLINIAHCHTAHCIGWVSAEFI